MGQDAEIRDPESGRAWRRVRIILESLVLVGGYQTQDAVLGGVGNGGRNDADVLFAQK